jgi:RNA-directed DNA polymerase
MAAWQDIPWTKVHRHVFRLQKRIYQATQDGRVRTARKLQKLLMKSWYARLLAVRRITQDNQGKDRSINYRRMLRDSTIVPFW